MANVTVYACKGLFCSKDGPPIENAVFDGVTYPGTWPDKHAVYTRLEATGYNPYTIVVPYGNSDVRVSAAGHGSSTQRMSQFSAYHVRI